MVVAEYIVAADMADYSTVAGMAGCYFGADIAIDIAAGWAADLFAVD